MLRFGLRIRATATGDLGTDLHAERMAHPSPAALARPTADGVRRGALHLRSLYHGRVDRANRVDAQPEGRQWTTDDGGQVIPGCVAGRTVDAGHSPTVAPGDSR